MTLAPILHKTIFQVRFNPDLSFHNLLHPAAKKLTAYPHWEATGLTVVLKDPRNRCSLTIGHNAIGYEQDSGDIGLEEKNVQEWLSVLPETMGIKGFTRLGYRRKYLIATDLTFESLVSIVDVKMFSQNQRFRALMPEKTEDILYRVDSADQEFRYHFTVAPVRKTEIPGLMELSRYHLDPETLNTDIAAMVKTYPEVALFFDFDVYQTSDAMALSKVEVLLNAARLRLGHLVPNLATYLFAESLEG